MIYVIKILWDLNLNRYDIFLVFEKLINGNEICCVLIKKVVSVYSLIFCYLLFNISKYMYVYIFDLWKINIICIISVYVFNIW